MDLIEQNLKDELQQEKASADSNHSGESNGILNESTSANEAQEDSEALKYVLIEKLENKKKELVCCMSTITTAFSACLIIWTADTLIHL